MVALATAAGLRTQAVAKPDPAAELARIVARYEEADDKHAAVAELRPLLLSFAKEHAGTEVRRQAGWTNPGD
jgi:hypothetical protein